MHFFPRYAPTAPVCWKDKIIRPRTVQPADYYTVYGKDDVRVTFKNGTEIKEYLSAAMVGRYFYARKTGICNYIIMLKPYADIIPNKIL